jgi:hypothetical protein
LTSNITQSIWQYDGLTNLFTYCFINTDLVLFDLYRSDTGCDNHHLGTRQILKIPATTSSARKLPAYAINATISRRLKEQLNLD